MITKDTLLKDLYKNTPYEKYREIFYYGMCYEEMLDAPLGHHYEGLWGNDDTVKSLNKFTNYISQEKVVTIYLSKDKPTVNLTIIKQEKKSNFALICAGGGYTSVATAVEGLPLGDYLYQKGFAVGYLAYSINDYAKNDGSYNDLVNALRYLFEHQEELNIDMTNYIAGGCSAGGHLIARLGTNNCGYKVIGVPKPALLFLAYPVVDFGKHAHQGSKRVLLGSNPTKKEEDKISIQNHVDSDFPVTYLWQCERDNVVDINNSKLLDAALTSAHVKHIYKTYDSDAHGWGLATNQLADHWLDEALDLYYKVIKD